MATQANAAPSSRPPTFPAVTNRRVVLGAALWTLSVLFFIDQAIAIAASRRPYSLATNLISDLGNTTCGPAICSPLHTFVNATFVVVGLCHALGALASHRAWPRVRSGRLGVELLAIAGAGLIVAGLSPENVDPAAHARGALVGLVALNLAMLALGWSILAVKPRLGRLAQGAGVVGLVGTGYFLAGSGAPGIAERIADYPSAAMVVVLGATLLVSIVSQARPAVAPG